MTREGNHTAGKVILLVDDEPVLRQLVRKILQRAGYTVLEAAGPREALDLVRGNPKIDLLLTDVVMPEMGGAELARQVTELTPDVPVVYMSGYPDETVTREGVSSEGTTFLRKPFSPELLTRTIRLALGGAA